MEATDPIIGLKIARSDVAFIHDVLMSCQFSGAQMLQASGIIAGLRPALKAESEVPTADKPEAKPFPCAVHGKAHTSAECRSPEGQAAAIKARPAKAKRKR